MFATKNGLIKKTLLEAYSRPRANGVIAINIQEGDEVVGVRLTNGHNELVLANRNGRAVRFDENAVRAMGRVSTGVRGMRLDGGDDEVVGMVVVNKPDEETIMVVSENGYGKRSLVEDYRVMSSELEAVVEDESRKQMVATNERINQDSTSAPATQFEDGDHIEESDSVADNNDVNNE